MSQFTESELRAITKAKNIIYRAMKSGPIFNSPQVVKDYLQLQIGHLEREVFGVLYLMHKTGLLIL